MAYGSFVKCRIATDRPDFRIRPVRTAVFADWDFRPIYPRFMFIHGQLAYSDGQNIVETEDEKQQG